MAASLLVWPFMLRACLPAGTLAAVWLRFEALRSSVKLKITLNVRLAKEALGGALVQGTRWVGWVMDGGVGRPGAFAQVLPACLCLFACSFAPCC